jgi:hypothetical protein
MQAINHTKSVKVLMQSVQMCQPQPKLPAELTKCIAKNHCAWHLCVPLLESHVILFPEDTRTFHALADLYRAVNEQDLALGLWRSKYAPSSAYLSYFITFSLTQGCVVLNLLRQAILAWNLLLIDSMLR